MVTTASGNRGQTPASPDRVYQITVPRRMGVRLGLQMQGFRGVLSLRRVCADDSTEVKCAEPGEAPTHIQLQTVLEAGTYFAVVDGSGPRAEGAFTLTLDAVAGAR